MRTDAFDEEDQVDDSAKCGLREVIVEEHSDSEDSTVPG